MSQYAVAMGVEQFIGMLPSIKSVGPMKCGLPAAVLNVSVPLGNCDLMI